MGRLGQDIRYALRQLTGAGASQWWRFSRLALGIGANTAIFSVVDSIPARAASLPAPGPAGAAQLHWAFRQLLHYPKGWIRGYQQPLARPLANISAYTPNAEYNVTGGGASDRVFGQRCERQSVRYAGGAAGAWPLLLGRRRTLRRGQSRCAQQWLLAAAVRRGPRRDRPHHAA